MTKRIKVKRTSEQADARVAFTITSEAEREEKKRLTVGMFDRLNWKLPTYRIETDDEDRAHKIADAISYFCGGSEITRGRTKRFSVGSLGYYHYVGA